MSKPESKVWPGIPLDATELKSLDVAGWQQMTRGWTAFQRDAIRRLHDATPDSRLELVGDLTKIKENGLFAQTINWTIAMGALGQEDLDKIITAITINDAASVYPKEKYRSPFGAGRFKLALYKFLALLGK